MREIKFRAWHKDRKKMYRFDEIFYCDEYNCMSWKLKDEDRDPDGGDYSNLLASTDDFELMQFTGLLDKNGKEIYEGDILDCGGFKAPVVFECGQFCIPGKRGKYFKGIKSRVNFGAIVVGNVHENPELLEKKP